MSLNYRPLQKSDRELCNSLMKAGKGYWGYPKERLPFFIERFGIHDDSYFDHALGFMVTEDESLIGFYAFLLNEEPCKLDHFFLDIPKIGKGYGRKLWEHCIEQAKRQGWREFVFWSDPHSLDFYQHMGAYKIDERPMVTMPGMMAPIMKFEVK